MTASLLFGVIAMILSFTSIVAFAVISRQQSADVLRLVNQVTMQYAMQQDKLLDRFQAIRWEDLAALRSIEEGIEEGGQTLPGADEEAEVTQESRGAWGALRVTTPPADDEELTREDFGS